MRGLRRRAFLLSLWSAALVAGCNFPSNLYFLMPESKEPAECKRLASEDGKKEVKVVLWTYMNNLDSREEFIQADRELSGLLAAEIRKMSEENHEKVTVVKPNLVEQYKSRHPNWQALEAEKIGHDFQADYVIDLEIDKLSLYEPSSREMYRGTALIHVAVVDVEHPDDMQTKEFTDRYPNEALAGLDTFDMVPRVFKEKFLKHVARKLAFYFVDHKERSRRVQMDE